MIHVAAILQAWVQKSQKGRIQTQKSCKGWKGRYLFSKILFTPKTDPKNDTPYTQIKKQNCVMIPQIIIRTLKINCFLGKKAKL